MVVVVGQGWVSALTSAVVLALFNVDSWLSSGGLAILAVIVFAESGLFIGFWCPICARLLGRLDDLKGLDDRWPSHGRMDRSEEPLKVLARFARKQNAEASRVRLKPSVVLELSDGRAYGRS